VRSLMRSTSAASDSDGDSGKDLHSDSVALLHRRTRLVLAGSDNMNALSRSLGSLNTTSDGDYVSLSSTTI
jgi:hypothetical protein